MIEWHDPKKELPEEYRAVIIWTPKRPWHHSKVGKGIFYNVAWLERGISSKEREEMKECKRKHEYRAEDEDGNNFVPYCWQTFGPDMYFGQEVKAWAYFNEVGE